MANDNEASEDSSAAHKTRDSSAAHKKRVSRDKGTVKVVPSVAETVETWDWLSTSLRNQLQQDLDESDGGQQEGPALRDADIE